MADPYVAEFCASFKRALKAEGLMLVPYADMLTIRAATRLVIGLDGDAVHALGSVMLSRQDVNALVMAVDEVLRPEGLPAVREDLPPET